MLVETLNAEVFAGLLTVEVVTPEFKVFGLATVLLVVVGFVTGVVGIEEVLEVMLDDELLLDVPEY